VTTRERLRAAIPEMQQMLAEGKKLREVALALGVTYPTLGRYRKEFGLTLGREHLRGSRHASWRGGRSIEKRSGYVRVRVGQTYVYEHTLVAEQKIGRRLHRGEVVHHINCDPTDNRPENLLVCSRSDHAKLHKQLERLGAELIQRGLVRFDGERYELAA
jgi:hypothetical protein